MFSTYVPFRQKHVLGGRVGGAPMGAELQDDSSAKQ